MDSSGSRPDVVFPELVNTSLAERARGAILKAILDRQFDDRLPSEDILASMLNVSRTTIRSALQGLEREGVITRRRAIGTTINRHVGPSTLALQRMVGFDWLLREKHEDVRVERELERVKPPQDFVSIFGLDPAEDCVYMRKHFLADGSRALWVRDVVPLSNLRSTSFADDVPASVFEFSKRYCSDSIDHAVVELAPMVVRKGVTELDVPEGQPFIRLHETHYTSDADVVAYSIIDVDDTYIRFEVFRRESL
jgi:GntR family transcriptional regulator